jgi:hypothetical protein
VIEGGSSRGPLGRTGSPKDVTNVWPLNNASQAPICYRAAVGALRCWAFVRVNRREEAWTAWTPRRSELCSLLVLACWGNNGCCPDGFALRFIDSSGGSKWVERSKLSSLCCLQRPCPRLVPS